MKIQRNKGLDNIRQTSDNLRVAENSNVITAILFVK